MQMKIQNLARMRAFNGDYTVFTTTTGEQGIAARQGNVIYGPTDKHQHITHSWGTLFAIMTIRPKFLRQQIDAATGAIIDKCMQYPGLGTDSFILRTIFMAYAMPTTKPSSGHNTKTSM